jgi:hypothetical protein
MPTLLHFEFSGVFALCAFFAIFSSPTARAANSLVDTEQCCLPPALPTTPTSPSGDTPAHGAQQLVPDLKQVLLALLTLVVFAYEL